MPKRSQPSQPEYDFDVFLSYRRRGPALDWVQNHFFPKLRGWLEQYWPDPETRPRIAKDDEMESGSKWPVMLRDMSISAEDGVYVQNRQLPDGTWVYRFAYPRGNREGTPYLSDYKEPPAE